MRKFCSAESELSLCLYGDTELALDPIIVVLRLDRFQGAWDRIGGLIEDDGSKRKHHRGHFPFAVCALQAFVFADQRFDHLAISG